MDSTLVIAIGEFGRTPRLNAKMARDHWSQCYCSLWAGAGVQGGSIHGATDELGFSAVKDQVTVQDWHATILHQLGLDHRKLTYNRNGFEEKLTGTFEAKLIKGILS